jgi:hypothetical protein
MPPARLKPLSDNLLPEVSQLANYLRGRFSEVEQSVRNYAGQSGVDAGTIRRYLCGEIIPPPNFVTKLLTHAAEKRDEDLTPDEVKKAQELRLEALRAVERARMRVEELQAQAEVAEAEKARIDGRIQNIVDLIGGLNGEKVRVEGKAKALESSWSGRAIEAAPRTELDRYERDKKALVRKGEDIEMRIDRLKIDLREAEAAKEAAEQRCLVLEGALKEAQRVYALVVEMVGRPDLTLPQSIVAYVDNRKLRWGGIVGMCIGPLILYALPAYLGVMFQIVSVDSFLLRTATLLGLIIPVWFAFGIRRLERAAVPRMIHLFWAIVVTVIIFFMFTLFPYQILG